MKAAAPVTRTGRAKVIVGVASRLAPVKGIVHLVDALAMIARSHPHVELVIAGDGPERPHIEAAVRQAHLEDRVHFTGWVDDIAGLMREWDIYAQPSLAEGLGIAALEAMSMGLPVVASDVGGLREIIVDGETGYLVPVKDSRALGRRIAELADDAALREKMGTAARSRVVSCFPFERESETIFAAYAELLA
jgi:glycosyltransferase involved in cell wall biosynthesis